MTNIKIASFETPPPKDKPFCAYTKFQRMFICKDWETFEKIKVKLNKMDEFVGWQPMHIDKNGPGMPPIPPPRKQVAE